MAHDENNFEQVGELLGTLKRVDPPGDFDVRVRARIAQGRPAEPEGSWLPSLARIAVPAVMLLALGGYFGYYGLYQPIQPVADVLTPNEPLKEVVGELPIPEPTDEVAVQRAPTQAFPSDGASIVPGVRPTANVRPTELPGGGSLDSTHRIAKPIRPPGLNPDRAITNANIGDSNAWQSASEVLVMLGIQAACSSAGCRVNSVSPNSVGANSGLRAGDVIEAMDGRPIGSNTTFSGSFSAGSVRVRRDGSIVNIPLRP